MITALTMFIISQFNPIDSESEKVIEWLVTFAVAFAIFQDIALIKLLMFGPKTINQEK